MKKAVVGALGLILAVGLLGVWLIVRDRSGEEVARIEIPRDGRIEIIRETPLALSVPNAEAPPARDKPPVAAGPDWLNKIHGQLNGKLYEIAVKSGLYVTIPECQRALEAAEKQAVREYLETYLGPGATDLVDLDTRYVHDHLRRQEYTETVAATIGDMQQLHALLVFDDSARDDFHDRWRQALVTRRLWFVGAGAAAVLAAVASAFGYLLSGARTTEREAVPR